MDLFKEILVKVFTDEEKIIIFPNIKLSAVDIIEMECYKTLCKIKGIIEDDSLADAECFQHIEAIVCLFEELGSNGGGRHDF